MSTWTEWLQHFDKTGDLEESAYQEFLRYACEIASRCGESHRYRDKGASYVASAAAAAALACVGAGAVDLNSSKHFRRLLGTIVRCKVANIKARREREKAYLERLAKEKAKHPNVGSQLEDMVVRELADLHQQCVLSQARDKVDADILYWGLLKDMSAGRVWAELKKKYDSDAVPAIRTIQDRLKTVREISYHWFLDLLADEDEEANGADG